MASQKGSQRGSTELDKVREAYISSLNHRKIGDSSYDLACDTFKYLRRFIGQGKYSDFRELLTLIKKEGDILVKADPSEFIIGNAVLKVLKIIREEHSRLLSGKEEFTAEDPHIGNKLWEKEEKIGAEITGKELKLAVVEALNELFMELETCRENIASQSTDHIQEGDTVLTCGNSRTALEFLKFAAKKAKFKILVAETAPVKTGRLLAEQLDQAKVGNVSVINDRSILQQMEGVTKVVLGANAILADGGFIGPSGTRLLALAAKRYSVPVIVLASFYKLTPKFLSFTDQETFNKFESPRKVIPFSEGDLVGGTEVLNVAFDLIPPDFVSLYITHTSGNSPSYVYRLLKGLLFI